MRTSFLELLTHLNDQGKIIPLHVEQRVKLIEILLNKTLKKFNFSLLICDDDKFNKGSKEFLSMWRSIYAQMWTSLAAKCPNLVHIKERRPDELNEKNTKSRLDTNVFSFSKLLTLDTDCYFDSGAS